MALGLLDGTTRLPGCAAKAGTSARGWMGRRCFVFTVCDRAAGETCPVWPGQPVTARQDVDDPAAFVRADDGKLVSSETSISG